MEVATLLVGIAIGIVLLWVVMRFGSQKTEKWAEQRTKARLRAEGKIALDGQAFRVRRDPKNRECIALARELLRQFPKPLADGFASQIALPLLEKHHDLAEYIDRTEELGLEAIHHVINFSSGTEIRVEIESAIDQSMESIVDMYREFVEETLQAVPSSDCLKEKYALSQDQIAQEVSKGTMALKRNLSPFFTELAEMSRLQNQLKSQFPSIRRIAEENDSFDWGSFLKGAGGGAMAAINPFVGIPMVLYNLLGESKKAEQQKQIVEEYFNNFQAYLGLWDKAKKLYVPIIDKQEVYLREKISNILEKAVPRILDELDAAGCSLKNVPAEYKKGLTELHKVLETA